MKLLLLLILCVASASEAASCLGCICKVESGCRPLGCHPDGGSDSCGYLQIKKAYYIDCGQPEKKSGESTDSAWKRCSKDKGCSTKCIKNYVKRYEKNCSGKGKCETMARLHNGGPNGCNIDGTVGYWKKVQKCVG